MPTEFCFESPRLIKALAVTWHRNSLMECWEMLVLAPPWSGPAAGCRWRWSAGPRCSSGMWLPPHLGWRGRRSAHATQHWALGTVRTLRRRMRMSRYESCRASWLHRIDSRGAAIMASAIKQSSLLVRKSESSLIYRCIIIMMVSNNIKMSKGNE